MGREIRRVPQDWSHPRDASGNYKPLFDDDYENAAQEWLQGLMDWEADKDGERTRLTQKYGTRYYWDWNGGPPDAEYYHPKWEQEPTHYQIYETVSEGTPVSPVFASLNEMKEWLLGQGYSEHAATLFVKNGWAPSIMFSPERGISGIDIHSLDLIDNDADDQ